MDSMSQSGRAGGQLAVLGGPTPLGWSVGFLETATSAVRDHLLTGRREIGVPLDVVDDLPAWPVCLAALLPLASPWTTELVVPHGDWTMYVNNQVGGGDPGPATTWIANHLGARWVVATHHPLSPSGNASTALWLGGPGGEPPLGEVRTVAAVAEDGRWSWHASGPVQPYERADAYASASVPDRLTREMLVEYLEALGIAVDDAGRYGAASVIRQLHDPPRRATT
jgi:hypothetical protein